MSLNRAKPPWLPHRAPRWLPRQLARAGLWLLSLSLGLDHSWRDQEKDPPCLLLGTLLERALHHLPTLRWQVPVSARDLALCQFQVGLPVDMVLLPACQSLVAPPAPQHRYLRLFQVIASRLPRLPPPALELLRRRCPVAHWMMLLMWELDLLQACPSE